MPELLPELLVEFYSEEIPARMQLAAAEQLKQRAEKLFKEQGLAVANLNTFVTPQRLVLVANLPAMLPARVDTVRGPKTDAPAQALQGFLGRYGLADASGLKKITVGKAEYYQLQQEIPGRETADILPELIATLRREFNWPKAMRHGESADTWVRPLHHLFILFNGQVLSAATQIFGHRFLSTDRFTPKDFADYKTQLTKRHVLLDHIARRAKIVAEANACAAQHGYQLATHDGMLDEVTGLVEYPFIKMGHFDASYLQLPPELLMAVMHGHQKYLPLRAADGALAAAFLFVANIPGSPDDAAMINGNQRVLRARLSDAKFFFEQDLATRLDDLLPQLGTITFHQKLGTMADKVQRLHGWIDKLHERYLPFIDLKLTHRAAALCKADLVSGMVGEFPELQGIMGRNYALAQGENAEVAAAIADHYQPMGPNAPVPDSRVSMPLALADKLDTLTEFFRIGEKPTGSKDPFALRRAALGIIRLLGARVQTFPLNAFVDAEVKDFLFDRLKVLLREEGIAPDVMAAADVDATDDPLWYAKNARHLHGYLQTEKGQAVRATYKRVFNILNAEEQKDKTLYDNIYQAALLLLPAEQALHVFLQSEAAECGDTLTFEDSIPLLNTFFDTVLVNDTDPAIRQNRLNLLAEFRRIALRMANFDMLPG